MCWLVTAGYKVKHINIKATSLKETLVSMNNKNKIETRQFSRKTHPKGRKMPKILRHEIRIFYIWHRFMMMMMMIGIKIMTFWCPHWILKVRLIWRKIEKGLLSGIEVKFWWLLVEGFPSFCSELLRKLNHIY